MAQPGRQLDFAEKPLGCDADQQLRMEDLEGDSLHVRVPREKDSGVATLTNLPFNLVAAGEGLAHQRQHIPPNAGSLQGTLYPCPEGSPSARSESKEDVGPDLLPEPPPERAPEIRSSEPDAGSSRHPRAPRRSGREPEPCFKGVGGVCRRRHLLQTRV